MAQGKNTRARKSAGVTTPVKKPLVRDDVVAEALRAGKPIKADAGKPRPSLIPPGPLLDIAAVMAFGAKKYDDHNWLKGFPHSRIKDALDRHLLLHWSGEELDEESGLPHLAHAGCCLLMLAEYNRDPAFASLDDRPHKFESRAQEAK